MPVINSPNPFFLLLAGGERIKIEAGIQTVTAEVAAHPFIVTECEFVSDDESATEEAPATDVDLSEEAAALGLKVDGRWSLKRLAAEIAKAKDAIAMGIEDNKPNETAIEATKDDEGGTTADANAFEQAAS